MKATGIVRRIDARVIITPRTIKPHKHWFINTFAVKIFYENNYNKFYKTAACNFM